MARKLLALGLGFGLVAALAVSATAGSEAKRNFHLMVIDEVYAGTAEDPTRQFIELRTLSANQTQLTGHSVTVYDPNGQNPVSFTFTGPVPNASAQGARILLATSSAEIWFQLSADLVMPSSPISGDGGKICFETVDCVSWGTYAGSNADSGDPVNPGSGILSDKSIDRTQDTDNSASDFVTTDPTPKNSFGQDGVPGGTTTTTTTTTTIPTSSTTTTTTIPTSSTTTSSTTTSSTSTTSTTSTTTTTTTIPPVEPEEHERNVSIRKDGKKIAGRVKVPDGTSTCRNKVPVKLQKKTPSGWKNVTGEAGNTAADGRYRFDIPDKGQRFRTKAARIVRTPHVCLAATSEVLILP
jgi:hypothetical protein